MQYCMRNRARNSPGRAVQDDKGPSRLTSNKPPKKKKESMSLRIVHTSHILELELGACIQAMQDLTEASSILPCKVLPASSV